MAAGQKEQGAITCQREGRTVIAVKGTIIIIGPVANDDGVVFGRISKFSRFSDNADRKLNEGEYKKRFTFKHNYLTFLAKLSQNTVSS